VVKLRSRVPTLDGVSGPARSDRRTTALVARLRAGDVAVLDQVDLDGQTAEALVDARVAVVLNRSAMISGRVPSRGAQVLADARIPMVDLVRATGGRELASVVPDGRRVRVLGGSVLVDDEVVAEGRELTGDEVASQLDAARLGMAAQLQTLTHDSAEFIRREEGLLLHGEGVPRLRTRLKGKPVVVVGHGPDGAAELRAMRRYLREMKPVVVTTAEGLDVVRAAGLRADVVVLDGRMEELPSAKELRAVGDVVVTEPPGVSRVQASDRFDRIGVRALTLQTSAAPGDAALLLTDASGAAPIVGVGLRGSIDELLDGSRDGLGSAYVARLKAGPRLVDATAVPLLYSGQLRARHAYLVVLIGLLAVALAVATTDVGHQWAVDLGQQLQQLVDDLRGRVS
jgi:uncharacterized membrane-anchored protein